MRRFSAVAKLLLTGLALLAGTLYAQTARADTIDFACGGSQACTGTIVQSGSNYSSTGIGVSASFENDPFTLVFDTSTDSISLLENGGTADEFVGTITQLSSSTSGGLTTLDFGVDWSTVPSDFDGTTGLTPYPSGSAVSITINGNAMSVDIPVVAPEPAALLLLLAGLVALVFLPTRRAGSLA